MNTFIRQEMSMLLIGSDNTAKLQFLMKIDRMDPKSQLFQHSDLVIDKFQLRHKALHQNFTVFIINDKQYNRGKEKLQTFDAIIRNMNTLLKDNKTVIIFFDVSISETWQYAKNCMLPMARSMGQVTNIALLGNNIQKSMTISLKQIHDFARDEGLELFFFSKQMEYITIYEDIAVWMQSRQTSNLLQQKSLNLKKIMGKLLPQDLALEEKDKERLSSKLEGRIKEMNKNFSNQANTMQSRLKQIYKISVGNTIKQQQGESTQSTLSFLKKQLEEYSLSLESKNRRIECLSKLKQKQEKEYNNLKQYHQLDEKQIKFLKQQNNSLKNKNQQLSNSLKNISQEQLNQIIQDLQSEIQSTEKNYKILVNQQSRVSLNLSIIQDDYYTNHNHQSNQIQTTLRSNEDIVAKNKMWKNRIEQLNERQIMNTNIMNKISKQHFQTIRSIIQQKEKKQIKKCNQFYQIKLCAKAPQTYISQSSNLLFQIQIKSTILLLYFSKVYPNDQVFLSISLPSSSLQRIQSTQRFPLWKYKKSYFAFGNMEIWFKFNDKGCCLLIQQRDNSAFKKENRTLWESLGLNEEWKTQGGFHVDEFEICEVILQ